MLIQHMQETVICGVLIDRSVPVASTAVCNCPRNLGSSCGARSYDQPRPAPASVLYIVYCTGLKFILARDHMNCCEKSVSRVTRLWLAGQRVTTIQ